MPPEDRLVLELDVEQRDRLMRVITHRGGRIVEERILDNGRLRIIAAGAECPG